MIYPKTVEIAIEDISELQQLLYLYLIDYGVINPHTLTEEEDLRLKNPKHRLKLIRDFADTYIYALALWRHTNVHTYDTYLGPVYEDYIKEELPHLTLDCPNLQEVFSNIETDIVNALPKKICHHTWYVWTVNLVAQSLVFKNEGDYRIIKFAEDALQNKDNPFYGKVSKGTLYRHELP